MKAIGSILKRKGGQIWSVAPGDTMLQAITSMAERGVGALLVLIGSVLVRLSGNWRSLSPEDRQLLIWRFYDTLTQGEIAERLGISQMSVSRKLTRLLADLRARTTGDHLAPAA